jgi:putative ABC transport system ATP-binding protein
MTTPPANLDSAPLVEAVDVVKVYGGATAAVRALGGVSLTIQPGERVALLGKSGSGKSTLLHLLAGLDQPTSGRLRVGGHALDQLDRTALARYRLTQVGIVFQAFHLLASWTALANVEMPLILAGIAPRERRLMALAALEAVGLAARTDHRPAELSGGEQQRVAIARALIQRPPLLLADEPTGNLDSISAAGIMELLEDAVHRHGAALVLVTHDEELARRHADRILRLQDGLLLRS